MVQFPQKFQSQGIDGSKGGGAQGTCAAPINPVFFIFMQFSGKIGLNDRLVSPPLGLVSRIPEILDTPMQGETVGLFPHQIQDQN